MFLVIAVAAGMLALAIWGRGGQAADYSKGLLMAFPAVIALAVAFALNGRAVAGAAQTEFYLDDEGVHQNPGFSIPWGEIRGVRVMNGYGPGTKVLRVAMSSKLKDRYWAFDATNVDLEQLESFADSQRED